MNLIRIAFAGTLWTTTIVGLLLMGCKVPSGTSASSTVADQANPNESESDEFLPNDGLEYESNEPKIETAEQYLKALADPKFEWFFQATKLPDAETKKLTQALRERYPFVSLRERLSYENQSKNPRNKSPQSSDLKIRALRMLHSEEVERFITNAGFGFTRMPPPSPRDLELFEFENRDTEHIDLFTFRPGSYADNPAIFEPLHLRFLNGFAGWTGAYAKSIDEVAGFRPHLSRTSLESIQQPNDLSQLPTRSDPYRKRIKFEPLTKKQLKKSKVWKLNHLQLVSLLKHDQPRVYVSDQLPNMEKLSSDDAVTRGLNSFETRSLQELRSGKNHVLLQSKNRIQMLGAIRAEQSCLDCHSVRKNELLGAFSYDIRVLKKNDKPKRRKPDDT